MPTAYAPVGANATETIPVPSDLEPVSYANDGPAWQRNADLTWSLSRGLGTQAMADANQTPAAAVRLVRCITTTGLLTANRDLTLPTLTNAAGREWIIRNACTGAFSIVVKCAAGTTVTIANGKSANVFVDAGGVTRVTADVTF